MIRKIVSYLSKSSLFADPKRDVADRNATFRRLDRLRRSATVSSRTGVTRLYRPTPMT